MSDRRLLLPDCKASTNQFARELAERIRDIRSNVSVDSERMADLGMAAVCATIYLIDNHGEAYFSNVSSQDDCKIADLKDKGGDVISYIGGTYYFNDDFYYDNIFLNCDMSSRKSVGNLIMTDIGANVDDSIQTVWWLWACDWNMERPNMEALMRACYVAIYGKRPSCYDEVVQGALRKENSQQDVDDYIFGFPFDYKPGSVYQSMYDYSIIDMIDSMYLLFDNIRTNVVQQASLNDLSW